MRTNPESEVSIGGAEIRAARRAANLTQRQLAERSNCSLSFLQLVERGAVPQRSRVLPHIVAALTLSGHAPAAEPEVRE